MNNKLLEIAKKNINFSYSPYSKFKVIAVLKTSNDKYYYGVNIENASYSLTICAERVAIFKAISEGEKEFKEILIYTNGDILPYPCGACLQVLSEFADENLKIYIANEMESKEFLFSELFPKRFEI